MEKKINVIYNSGYFALYSDYIMLYEYKYFNNLCFNFKIFHF